MGEYDVPGYRPEQEWEPHVDPNAPPVRGYRLVPAPALDVALKRVAELECGPRGVIACAVCGLCLCEPCWQATTEGAPHLLAEVADLRARVATLVAAGDALVDTVDDDHLARECYCMTCEAVAAWESARAGLP